MDLDTKLTVKIATDAETPANSASRRTESNGRRPGPGFGLNPGKTFKLYLLTRVIQGLIGPCCFIKLNSVFLGYS